jgi:acetyl-CoA C-acetyltransferase
MAARSVVILGAARTPIGRADGAMKGISAADLGAVVARAALDRARVPADEIDEILIGQSAPAAAHNAGLLLRAHVGIPAHVPAYTIDKGDASGLQALAAAAQSILLGESECVLACAIEAATPPRAARQPHADDAVVDLRRNSQSRFDAAQQAGHFAREIAPVVISAHEKTVSLDADETGAVDDSRRGSIAAAALILASDQWALDRGLTPLAHISGWASAALDPASGAGAVPAIAKLKERYGFELTEFDLVELHASSAAQLIAALRDIPIPHEKVNVNGTDAAAGHHGAYSGARIVVSLLYELQRRNARTLPKP